VAISDLNVVIFNSQSAGQEPTVFASQPLGLTEGLQVGSGDSGHENLDQFHLCHSPQGLTEYRSDCCFPEVPTSRLVKPQFCMPKQAFSLLVKLNLQKINDSSKMTEHTTVQGIKTTLKTKCARNLFN